MGTNRGTDLYNIWKTVAAVGDDIEIFKSDIMYTSTLNGESLSLYRDLEKTRQEMIKLSKEDENEINELIKDVKIAMDVEIPAYKPMEFYGPIELLKMMKKQKNTLKLFKKYKNQYTQDLMNKFKHPLIKCLI